MMKERCVTKELQNSQLNPNIHQNDIIRLHGRLQNTDLSHGSINPIPLPRKDTPTILTIEDIHTQKQSK